MLHILVALSALSAAATAPQDALDAFVRASEARHGEAGKRAAAFLVAHMPEADRAALSPAFLSENLDLAFAARAEFPWAKAVPEELFWNDVLPYAVFDEPRDPWRKDLLGLARPIVAEAKSASEAAQALNAKLFHTLGLHYNTGRKRPNQSFRESREQGKATCTGLSITLVEACRAVGIPARAVGTPLWANKRGNHTWIELWDGDWHFAGADEYDSNGLDRGWFVGDASQARADLPEHRIYATSWKRAGLAFPMVWSPGVESVAAVDVTARYAQPLAAPSQPTVGVRVLRKGERVVARLRLSDAQGREVGSGETRAGTADLNDMPSFALAPQGSYTLAITFAGETRTRSLVAGASGVATLDLEWSELEALSPALAELEAWLAKPAAERGDAPTTPLTRDEAAKARARLALVRLDELRAERAEELEKRELATAGVTLRWLEKRFGDAPEGSRSLWISMHGGGGAPKEVNDQQWQNQIKLYEPAEGFYVAPRAPTDTWNLWHQGHIDPCFDRLIEDYVALRGVSPDRVYLMGYSAGGDGVWQLAPRMADRFAAAAMMAGHPNEAQLDGLRNLPFAIFMGANDGAYDRNKIAAARGARLGELRAADPQGYEHFVRIYEGLGHWMQRKDAEGVPWMAGFTRRAWPERIVWLQDDITHERFYWLALPAGTAQPGARIEARIAGNHVQLESDAAKALSLRLSDELLDLDQPVTVHVGDQQLHAAILPRTARALWLSLRERADPATAASAHLDLRW